MQISDIGNKHIVKGKERGDNTPFDKLNPIVSAVDNTYEP
jgi:methyl coenzyme M reductase subunit C